MNNDFKHDDLIHHVDPFQSMPEKAEMSTTIDDAVYKEMKEQGIILKNIEKNTNFIKELVELTKESNVKTEDIAEILTMILEISKASSGQEANNLLAKSLDKINSYGELIENSGHLIKLAMFVYGMINM